MSDDAIQLLRALREAGCHVYVDAEDGECYCSPPMRHIEWPDDPEEAIEEWRDALRELVAAETMTIH